MAGRFAELIDRQLDLFEQEDADFLARLDQAERDYDRADREDAEEVYGRFQELVEFGTEALAELRDSATPPRSTPTLLTCTPRSSTPPFSGACPASRSRSKTYENC